MTNDLTGTQGSSGVFPRSPTATSPLTEDTATQKTGAPDLQAYDSIDTMGSIAFVPQQFISKTIYEASAPNPMLLQPDSESEWGPKPYGTAEQKLIIGFFNKRLKELLSQRGDISDEQTKAVFNAIMSGKPPSDPQLAKLVLTIGTQVKQETREKAHLPESWDPQSPNPKDWIPLPIQPYTQDKQAEINQYYDAAVTDALSKYISQATPPLNQNQIDQLQKAITSGKVSVTIAEAFTAITKTASEATQKAYGLSESWFKGTSNIDEWKPINLGIVAPAAVNEARVELIIANSKEFISDIEKAANKILEGLSPNDPNAMSMQEFKSVIAKALQKLKSVLRDIQLKDSEQSEKALQTKLDALDGRQKRLEEDIEKRKEMEEKQKKAKKLGTVMKILGPIISALAVVVGAALAIFTGGASIALIVAGIAIGTAMTAYSIVDSCTGCTQKIMEAFNALMEKAFPDNPLAQKLLKAFIVAIIAAVLIVAIVASGGGAAANIATSVAVQTIKEMAKQLSIQMLIMVIMASNALPELLGAILKKAGVDENQSKIWEIVMMAITMITVMVALAVGGKGGGLIKGISEGFKSAGRTAQQIASRAGDLMNRLIDTLKKGAIEATEAIIKMLKKVFKQLMDSLNNLGKTLADLPANLSNAIKNGIQRVKEAVQEFLVLINNPDRLKQAFSEGIAAAANKVGNALHELSEAISAVAVRAKDALVKSGDIALEQLQAAIKKVSDLSSAFLTKLSNIPGAVGKQASDVLRGIKTWGEGVAAMPKFFSNLIKMGGAKMMGTEITTALASTTSKNLKQFALTTQKTLEITPMVINIADGINRGILGLEVVKLLKEIGANKEAEELLQAHVQMIDKLITSIQSGVDTRSEFILSLQHAYNEFFNAMGRNTTKIFQTLQG